MLSRRLAAEPIRVVSETEPHESPRRQGAPLGFGYSRLDGAIVKSQELCVEGESGGDSFSVDEPHAGDDGRQ